MDPEKDEQRKDENQKSNILRMGRDAFKKAKNTYTMIAKRLPVILVALPIVIKLFVIIAIAALVTTFFSTIFNNHDSSTAAGVASMKVIKDEVDISKADNDEDGYYFKINEEIFDGYIKRVYCERNHISEEEYGEEEKKKAINNIKDWFKTEDFEKYFVKMIRAEIASTYPKLGNYEGTVVDDEGNTKDSNGNYVAQGIVEIHRQKINKDGTVEGEVELQYLPHEEFSALVKNNDPKALNYFSFEPEGLIYYATYKEKSVTIDGVEDESQYSYELEEKSASYKALTSMCSMPYNFLFALLQTSKNPIYVMAVADLLLEDSEVVLMIQDGLNNTVLTDVSYQVQKTEQQKIEAEQEGTDTSSSWLGGTSGSSDEWRNPEDIWTPVGEEREDTEAEEDIPVYKWKVSDEAPTVTYTFPAGESQTVITTTYENTANVYIKKAKTWCMEYEQEAELNQDIDDGEPEEIKYTDSDFASLEYTLTEDNRDEIPEASQYATFTIAEVSMSTSKLPYTQEKDIIDYNWKINSINEKMIDHKKFLGLWKNDTGLYYKGCLYDPDGIDVGYPIPGDDRPLDVVVYNIADHQKQTIADLIDLLSLHEDTQAHEQLMKYYWNIYYGEEIYSVDVSELLDLFSSDNFISASGSRGSGLLIKWPENMEREEFIECMNNSNFKGVSDFTDENAGIIYDICTENGINPILCVSQAALESGWGKYTGASYNYWGIEVYTDTSNGSGYSSLEKAVQAWCNIMKSYLNDSEIANSPQKQYSNKFSSGVVTIYDAAIKYCSLPSPHNESCYGGTSKDFIKNTLNLECDHADDENVTDEEQAAYSIWYGDQVTSIAKDIFGTKALGGIGLTSAEDEAMLELQIQLAAKIGLSAEADLTRLNNSWKFHKKESEMTPYRQAVMNIGDRWYGTNENQIVSQSPDLIFQCTWWACGRASEYLGRKVFDDTHLSDAREWLDTGRNYGYQIGQEPRAGSIVVWDDAVHQYGHVAFVEGVSEDGYVYISHAGSGKTWFGVSKLTKESINNVFSGYSLLGYIYLD